MEHKMKLYGFNHLTKSMNFNMYDVCYVKTEREQREYMAYVDEQYNSERLTNILRKVTDMIGAHIINISKQDYEPQGTSVTVLIAEGSMVPNMMINANNDIVIPEIVAAHLDKSHVTVHTYPEFHSDNNIATFRVDIDVATCGEITPLKTLDFLIESFDSDIITIDYRVRGFIRDLTGKKIFMDHKMNSIQNFIDEETLKKYDAMDVNVYQSNIYHTKLLMKEVDLQNYLFNMDAYEMPPRQRLEVANNIREEMIEIYSGTNVF